MAKQAATDKGRTSKRSRRDLLAGAAGALGVMAAQAVARGQAALADDGDPLILGQDNVAQSSTAITAGEIDTGPALQIAVGELFNEPALRIDVSDFGDGLSVFTTLGTGIRVSAPAGDGINVMAEDSAVKAIGGVGGPGLWADNSYGEGIDLIDKPAIVGRSVSYWTFMEPVEAIQAEAVRRENGKFGKALNTIGEVRFQHSSGIATIPKGEDKKTVQLEISLGADSMILATSNGPGGMVKYVGRNLTGNEFTIFLTANATSDVPVAWFVISGA